MCGQAGHTARNCTAPNITRTAPKAPSGQAISITAPLLLGTFNLFVIETFGKQCGVTEKEAHFLTPSLQRTLERMPKGAAERMAVVIDPAIIIAVLLMWFKRIGDVKRAEALQKYVVSPHEQARANGVSGTEYRTETSADHYTNNSAEQPHVFQSDPSHPAHCAVCMLPYDNMNAHGQPLHFAQQSDIPMPDRIDFTANGVPTAIRDSFDTSL